MNSLHTKVGSGIPVEYGASPWRYQTPLEDYPFLASILEGAGWCGLSPEIVSSATRIEDRAASRLPQALDNTETANCLLPYERPSLLLHTIRCTIGDGTERS